VVHLEFISSLKPQNTAFGIANVQSRRCSLTIGYYLGETSLTLLLPESCNSCRKAPICSREFGIQIIQKYNQRHKGAEIHFLF
jgi:hypothetical protein